LNYVHIIPNYYIKVFPFKNDYSNKTLQAKNMEVIKQHANYPFKHQGTSPAVTGVRTAAR
jgi:hypothetical protein